jgi:glycoprotein-N-acetylgalactosamine 3-beta-galactosyltransferase
LLIKINELNLVDYYRSRLFCFVLTNQDHLDDQARAVYETWGYRCGRFIFIARLNSSRSYTIFDNENNFLKKTQLPIQYIPTLPDEKYSHLSDKIRATLLFISKYYPNYNWYLKADDDTYIIIENLLRFLISTIK